MRGHRQLAAVLSASEELLRFVAAMQVVPSCLAKLSAGSRDEPDAIQVLYYSYFWTSDQVESKCALDLEPAHTAYDNTSLQKAALIEVVTFDD